MGRGAKGAGHCTAILINLYSNLFRNGKSAVTHKRGDVGIAASESAVSLGGINGIARGEEIIDKLFGHVRIIKTTRRFFEGFGGVRG